MTVTVGDLITLALQDSGVVGQGQTPSAFDMFNAYRRLNFMVAQWNRKRWLIYHLIDASFTSTGALSYTVGLGGDFNINRPDRLEFAFFRQLVNTGVNQIDYPLQIIESREDYDRIALKTMGTWPSLIFYDSAFPLGSIFVWPVPQASLYQIHLTLKETISAFTSVSQTINLPPEYEAAIHYNLCARLRPAYQMDPDPSITALALESLNVMRGANAQISSMRLPNAVVQRRYAYNVFSDQF